MIDLTEEKKQVESSIDYKLRDHILELLNKTYNQEGEAYTLNFRDFGEFVSKEYFNNIVSELVSKLDKVIGEQRNSYIKDQTLFTVKIKNEIKDAIESHYVVVGNALFRDYPDYIRKIKIRLGWIEINDDGIYHIEDYYGYYRESDYEEGEFPTCEVVRKDDYAKVNELKSQGFRLIELEGFKWVRVEKFNKEDERLAIFKDNNIIYQPETVYVKGSMVEYEGEEEPKQESFIFDGWSPNTGKPINNNTVYIPKYYKTNGVLDLKRSIPDSILTIFKHQENYPIGSWKYLDYNTDKYQHGDYYDGDFIRPMYLVKFTNKDWALISEDQCFKYRLAGIASMENFESGTGIYSYKDTTFKKYLNTTYLDMLSNCLPVEFLTEKRRVSFGLEVGSDILPYVDPETLPYSYDTQYGRVRACTLSSKGYLGFYQYLYREQVSTGNIIDDHRSESIYGIRTGGNIPKDRYNDKLWIPNLYEISGKDRIENKAWYFDGTETTSFSLDTEQEGTPLNINETFKNLPSYIYTFYKHKAFVDCSPESSGGIGIDRYGSLMMPDIVTSSFIPHILLSNTSWSNGYFVPANGGLLSFTECEEKYSKDFPSWHIRYRIIDYLSDLNMIINDSSDNHFRPKMGYDPSEVGMFKIPLLCITFP